MHLLSDCVIWLCFFLPIFWYKPLPFFYTIYFPLSLTNDGRILYNHFYWPFIHNYWTVDFALSCIQYGFLIAMQATSIVVISFIYDKSIRSVKESKTYQKSIGFIIGRVLVQIRAVESEVPSSNSGQFRLSDSGPTPTFSCISYLKW